MCRIRHFYPKKLLSSAISGNAAPPSAFGGRLRQTLVWPLRWVGAPPCLGLAEAFFFTGQNVKPPGSNPHGFGSSSAARCPLGAPPAGAERAICGPTEAASHLASPRIRHGPFRRFRLRFSSSPPPFPFRTMRWRLAPPRFPARLPGWGETSGRAAAMERKTLLPAALSSSARVAEASRR